MKRRWHVTFMKFGVLYVSTRSYDMWDAVDRTFTVHLPLEAPPGEYAVSGGRVFRRPLFFGHWRMVRRAECSWGLR